MKKSQRLIEQFIPKKYTLKIEPDIKKLVFKGNVCIEGELPKDSDQITFHAIGITLEEVVLEGNKYKGSKYNSEDQELTINFEETISAGEEIVLNISYEGIIGQSNTGLYVSSYEEDGEEVKMLATQLEPASARKVFPGIDEPSAKAVFQVTTVADKEMTIISNTLIDSENTEGSKTTTIFKETPKMSTYLLAIIMGYMQYEEIKTNDGVVIRSYGIKKDIIHADFGLQTAKKVVEWYNDFFGVPYPLENLNMVGMPDFEAGVGAMENWGCITYRADSIFVDPNNTSLAMKQYCGIVVAHEIAHQWFGNLVTMAWWDDLWLNEGFATWAEYKVATTIFPEWNLWSDFLSNDFVRAMQLDSRTQSHPIVAKIDNIKQIAGAFDAITYRKGASVIRMLEAFVGENDFRDGVQAYIEEYQYSNATTDDLWKSISEVSGKNVKEFMHSWTDTEGHPIIEISDDEIVQTRFSYNPLQRNHQNKQSWLVPLTSSEGLDILLEDKVTKLEKPMSTEATFNNKQAGFYRIKYTQQMLQYFNDNYDSISEEDRIGLFFDAFDQAEAGYLNIKDVLPLLGNLKSEESSHVWDSALTGLGAIHNLFLNDSTKADFLSLNKEWLETHIERLGFETKPNEAPSDTLIRPQVIAIASKYGHKQTVEKLLEMFQQNIPDSVSEIDPDLRGVVYSTAAREGGSDVFDKLLKLYENTSHSEEERRISSGLCAFDDLETGIKVRKLITSDKVRVQDAYVWIIYSYMNRHQRKATWEWFKDEWTWIAGHYEDSPLFNDFLRRFADKIEDEDMRKDVIGFVEDLDLEQLKLTIKQMHDIADTNIDWKQRDAKLLQELFTESL